ncbi:helix-turn-helix domain-containing protein [Paenibacillus sp. GCM10023252]|uniref:helix-turn-helix domain-containing protein n=1 Tax=Paenibacillus sp. GCM10023252 TaxID=3252649 RepID=UPI0036090DE1
MNCIQLSIPPLPQFMTVGRGTWKIGMQHFERSFNVYDMLFVARGALYMTENGIPYTIEPGQLLVMEPGLTHYGHRGCQEETEIYWVHFAHGARAQIVADKQIAWSTILQHGTDFDQKPREQLMFLPKYGAVDLHSLQPLLNEMVHIQSHLNLGNALQLHSLLARLLTELQLGLQRSSKPSQSLSLSHRVEQFLAERLGEPFHAGELERELHFNFDYMTKCMKKHRGMTPLQFSHYLKVEEAKRLLAHTELPVPAIAEQVGIPDYNYFIRLFRGKTGITPSVYRKSKQGVV